MKLIKRKLRQIAPTPRLRSSSDVSWGESFSVFVRILFVDSLRPNWGLKIKIVDSAQIIANYGCFTRISVTIYGCRSLFFSGKSSGNTKDIAQRRSHRKNVGAIWMHVYTISHEHLTSFTVALVCARYNFAHINTHFFVFLFSSSFQVYSFIRVCELLL